MRVLLFLAPYAGGIWPFAVAKLLQNRRLRKLSAGFCVSEWFLSSLNSAGNAVIPS